MSKQSFNSYQSPLVARNATPPMCEIFSDQRKFSTWRRLWLALAEAEKDLGLPVTDGQIAAMRAHLDDIDFRRAAHWEKRLRHDVMAHIRTFGEAAPEAAGIIHLGATSAFVGDNTDIILLREGLCRVRDWLANVIDRLAAFARKYRSMPALGFTHYQPAQITTVGKRASLWCHDFVLDLVEIEHRIDRLALRGVKGTTGTQASFLALFDGDGGKVDRLERLVARKLGFTRCYPVTGQTYSRKVDAQIVSTLADVAATVHKCCNDLRLLANLKEIEEPFEAEQVGSSAMAYKRNPMRCERATGLARFVMSLADSARQTAAEQWLERTLDDSANRRLTLPESFLATDGMLNVMLNVFGGLVVYPKVIAARIASELPFMATEDILMAAVAAGGDRQEVHERIRQHSQAAAAEVQQHGRPNDLIGRLEADPAFAEVDFQSVLAPGDYIGRCPEQVLAFIKETVTPIRRRHRKALGMRSGLAV